MSLPLGAGKPSSSIILAKVALLQSSFASKFRSVISFIVISKCRRVNSTTKPSFVSCEITELLNPAGRGERNIRLCRKEVVGEGYSFPLPRLARENRIARAGLSSLAIPYSSMK